MRIKRIFCCLVVAGTCLLSDRVISQTGVIVFYPFYGSPVDESGNNLSPDSLNFTYTEDRFGNTNFAADFSDGPHFMIVGDTVLLDITGQITMETWVKPISEILSSRQYILVKPVAANSDPTAACYALMTNASSTAWEFQIGGYIFEFGQVESGSWTHLAMTFSHLLQRAKCYQNGELVAEFSALLNNIPVSDQPLIIGANLEQAENFSGVIDDIRLFDVALDSTQIDSLYSLPFGPNFQLTPTGILNFHNVYIGYPDTLFMRITNYGLGPSDLSIFSVSIPDTQFTTNLEPQYLPSGANVHFDVVFDPVVYNTSMSTLTITSNDSLHSPCIVTLIGQAVPPPEPVFTPLSFSDTLYSGAEATFELMVQNLSPDGPLQYRSRLLDSLGDSTLFFEKQDWTDWQDSANQDRITPNVWIARDNYGGIFNARYEITYDAWSSPVVTEWAFGRHPQPENSYLSWASRFGVDPHALLLQTVNAWLTYDEFFLDFWFQSWTDEGNGGGFSYLREIVPQPWIEYDRISGFLWPGQSINQSITFQADQLPPGEYVANIGFWLNDPEIPLTLIPLSLLVLEGPDFSIDKDTLDFFYGFLGHPDTVFIEVTNRGLGILDILDITLPGPDISIIPGASSLEADSSQIFQLIFNPASTGDQSGDLVFNTNDPDEGLVNIPVVAVGSEPPVIRISADSLNLNVGGSSGLDTIIQITNEGNSALYVHFLPMTVVEENIAYHSNPSLTDFETFWGPLYEDPQDSAHYLDMRSIVFGATNNAALIQITTAQSIQYPFQSISLFIDMDRNQATGTLHPVWEIGYDYEIVILLPEIQIYGNNPVSPSLSQLIRTSYESGSNELLLSLPFDLFGESPAWNAGLLGFNGYTDFLPDEGPPLLIPLPADWVQVDPPVGNIPAGSSANFLLHIDPEEEPSEPRELALHIMSNDPVNPDVVMTLSASTTSLEDDMHIPETFLLNQNFPNPFNPVTTLRFGVPEQAQVLLIIYDIRGHQVCRLVENVLNPGYHEVIWDGTSQGRPMPSGIYFARLATSRIQLNRKMVLLR